MRRQKRRWLTAWKRRKPAAPANHSAATAIHGDGHGDDAGVAAMGWTMSTSVSPAAPIGEAAAGCHAAGSGGRASRNAGSSHSA